MKLPDDVHARPPEELEASDRARVPMICKSSEKWSGYANKPLVKRWVYVKVVNLC